MMTIRRISLMLVLGMTCSAVFSCGESMDLLLGNGAGDGDTDADTDGDTDADSDGDTDADVDGDTDADVDGDTDADVDGDTDADVDGDTDADVDGDTDADVDGDTDADVDGDTDADVDGDTDADVDGDTDADVDGDTDADVDGDTDADVDGDTDADVDGDTDADSDGDTDADSDGDTDADTDGDSDADTDADTDIGEHHVLGSGALLVSGTVQREETAHSWNDPFVATEDAHVRAIVSLYEAEDAPTPTLFETDFPFEGLPFSFEIRGDFGLSTDDTVLVDFSIFNHAGTNGAIGDLLDEYWDGVSPGTEDVDILVSGLESCDAPYAGGYCISVI